MDHLEDRERSSSDARKKSEPDSFSQDEEVTDLQLFDGDLEANREAAAAVAASQSSIARTLSRRLSGAELLYKEAEESTEPLPKMGGGKPYPPKLPSRDPYSVEWDGPTDPEFPHNWPLKRKLYVCAASVLSALSVIIGSAFFSEASESIMETYHVGSTVATLGVSLFVFGFASGPVVWGPLSELHGRKPILIMSMFGYTCFSFAVGSAKDLQTIMICRFFAGFVGAAPLVVAPASMAEVFTASVRGKAMTYFAMVLFGGPMIGPILGAFTVKNPHLGWRWTSYFCGILGVLGLLSVLFIMEETHHGLILARKAETLRRRTGNWGIHAPHETVSLSIKEVCEKNLARPVLMLVTEPILFLITLYNAFIYGLLYLFLTAVPLIFSKEYRFQTGVAELPYFAMLIGIFVGGILSIFLDRRYVRAMEKNNGKPVPEERLPPMMVGGVLFAIGLFWLCWTGDFADSIPWIVPTLGTVPIGAGLILIFLPCLNYIIDCYLLFAASALAGNTLLRSAFGAAFPLFALQMFDNMGIKWAGTLLGCIAVALIPVPFLFYKYGKRLRQKSKWTFDL